MKKTILATTLLLFIGVPTFAEGIQAPKDRLIAPQEFKKPDAPRNFNKEEFNKRRAEFDNRLNLSEEQKAKAKELREQGRKNIEPLMKSAGEKRDRIRQIKESSLSEAQKQEIQKLDTELRGLHKQMHEQRMKNMKEFESILNEKQLKELQKIKEEGRKNFEKNHPGKGFEGKRPMPPSEGINPPRKKVK